MLVAEWDYELDKAVTREESLLEGRLEGRLEALREVVEQMYKGGFSIAEIVKATPLSEKDVNEILGL